MGGNFTPLPPPQNEPLNTPLRLGLNSFFVFVNDPQALYVNLGCLKCISGINLSLDNKKIANYFTNFISCINLLILIKQ